MSLKVDWVIAIGRCFTPIVPGGSLVEAGYISNCRVVLLSARPDVPHITATLAIPAVHFAPLVASPYNLMKLMRYAVVARRVDLKLVRRLEFALCQRRDVTTPTFHWVAHSVRCLCKLHTVRGVRWLADARAVFAQLRVAQESDRQSRVAVYCLSLESPALRLGLP